MRSLLAIGPACPECDAQQTSHHDHERFYQPSRGERDRGYQDAEAQTHGTEAPEQSRHSAPAGSTPGEQIIGVEPVPHHQGTAVPGPTDDGEQELDAPRRPHPTPAAASPHSPEPGGIRPRSSP